MTSVATVDTGVKLQEGLQILSGKAGMEIGKWDSNNPQVLEHVPLEGRAKNSKFKIEDDKFVSKALGVQWDSHNDFLLFEGFQFRTVERVTKRVVLSEMSRVFDPLGLLSPVTVKIKIFFQRLWNPIELDDGHSHVLGWDVELLESHKSEWDAYQQGMSRVSEVKIPRVLCVTGTQSFELHGFSDASERAYSAVVYLRCFREDGSIYVGLVCEKTKVVPLKSQTIPKLELCGGLLLARLITAVVTGTSVKCPIYAWTDSELVLKWLAGSSRRWKTFVANRVAEIQLAIPNESWKFVPGEINPADCASRGMTADELLDHDLWWSGPDFLHRPGLPTFVGKEIPASYDMEEKSNPVIALHVSDSVVSTNEWFSRYSDLLRLKRMLAYVLRFKYNCSVKLQVRRSGFLSACELQEAFMVLVKLAQSEDFSSELSRLESGKKMLMTSKILTLNPFIDQTGVLTVGGRLQRSIQPSAAKHQIIVSGAHQLTKLLICHGHSELHHAGFQLLWAHLQRDY